MDIRNKTVLVIGGWGLVGSAVCRKLIPEGPRRIIITSLKKEEAFEQIAFLKKEFPKTPKNMFIPWWGNVLVRDEFKDTDRGVLLADAKARKVLMADTLEELSEDILHAQSLYRLIKQYKPEIIIDCINTATGIAYQDVYTLYRSMKPVLDNPNSAEQIAEQTERLLCSLYIPQLIRHIQILYNSMREVKTQIYFKIGTSGTGGMGLNIPYTHSEERPSRVLLSKSAVAGAHTLLLFLMARTPDAAITKEIKPTAAIAWKKIEYGPVKKRGKAIEILDVPFTSGSPLGEEFSFKMKDPFDSTGEPLRSVFIDTGENGIFSRGEFEAISAQKQMEFVTPEEIADNIIFEMKGGNTGHDVINALDNATLNPTYRAGYMQHFAVDKLARLEKEHNVASVAFEMLGPPRLSKLLYEIHLLRLVCGSMRDIVKHSGKTLAARCTQLLQDNDALRNEIVSIGIPILLPDGKTLIRGNEVKIPVRGPHEKIKIEKHSVNQWAKEGWLDLRESNMKHWQNRIHDLMNEAEAIPSSDTSSLHVRNKEYWNNFGTIDIGRVVSWIFIHEEQGKRMKD